MHLRTKAGCHHDLVQAFERLGVRVVLSDQPGLLDAELAVSISDENDHLVIGEWASPEHYERWLAGHASALLQQVAHLLEHEPRTHVYRVIESVS
jgi:quinol monooxygenase YgiN